MRHKRIFIFSGAILLVALGAAILALSAGSHDSVPMSHDTYADKWSFGNVELVTVVERREDGRLNWIRGFRCVRKQVVEEWESAVGYEEMDYQDRFEILSAWKIGNMIYYRTKTGLYAYPDLCNSEDPHESRLFLAFPPAE